MSNSASQSAATLQDRSANSWPTIDVAPLPEDRPSMSRHFDLAELYRAHSSKLTRFFARRTGNSEEGQDLMQESFARLIGSGSAVSGAVERPEAYLNRVSRNLLRDRAKTNSRRSSHLHLVADDESLTGPDQQHLLETRDMLRRLEAAMLKLKPKTREIFMAHRLDGLSYAEIAERTGLSIKGVESQMSKAIAHLDRMLDR